jgi:hypothetical protein
MGIERPAFTTTRTEEERALDKHRIITLRLNEQEAADLETDMRLMDIGVDSAAIKLLVEIGRKVIQDQIGADHIKYLVSRERTRYDGRKR